MPAPSRRKHRSRQADEPHPRKTAVPAVHPHRVACRNCAVAAPAAAATASPRPFQAQPQLKRVSSSASGTSARSGSRTRRCGKRASRPLQRDVRVPLSQLRPRTGTRSSLGHAQVRRQEARCNDLLPGDVVANPRLPRNRLARNSNAGRHSPWFADPHHQLFEPVQVDAERFHVAVSRRAGSRT